MFQRSDGIVEFDKDACIGCKACIAACPYDAIYIDPDNGTAAKCNFCAHRLDVGLEPACVVVCPEEALIFGDLDDPLSKVSQLIGREKTQVRKPEKDTDPKCFYIGADEAVLNPDVQTHDDSGLYMWSMQRKEKHGAALDNNKPHGLSLSSALNAVTGARVAYDVHHDIPWGHYVSLYLFTKSIAAGTFLIGWTAETVFLIYSSAWPGWLADLVSLAALALTGALLVADLDRPERFFYILIRPQWKSWLTIGAFIILGYSLLLVLHCGLSFLNSNSSSQLVGFLREVSPWIYNCAMPFAAMTAIYTAFLFAQAKGRDLWQSSSLPLHLLVQAIIAGSAFTLLAILVLNDPGPLRTFCTQALGIGLLLHLFLIITGEVLTAHSSRAKQRAVNLMLHGPYKNTFWIGAIVCGAALPLLFLGLEAYALIPYPLPLDAAASCLALAGLLAYEHCFVMAGQSVRLS